MRILLLKWLQTYFHGSFTKRETSDTSTDSEWYNESQRMTTIDNEWQPVVISSIFPFFGIREKPTTKHPKENSLNFEEGLEDRLLN